MLRFSTLILLGSNQSYCWQIWSGSEVESQKPFFMVSFQWTKPRTLQEGPTALPLYMHKLREWAGIFCILHAATEPRKFEWNADFALECLHLFHFTGWAKRRAPGCVNTVGKAW